MIEEPAKMKEFNPVCIKCGSYRIKLKWFPENIVHKWGESFKADCLHCDFSWYIPLPVEEDPIPDAMIDMHCDGCQYWDLQEGDKIGPNILRDCRYHKIKTHDCYSCKNWTLKWKPKPPPKPKMFEKSFLICRNCKHWGVRIGEFVEHGHHKDCTKCSSCFRGKDSSFIETTFDFGCNEWEWESSD